MKLSLVMASSNSDFGNIIFRDPEPAVPTPEHKRLELCIYTLHEAFKAVDYEVVFIEWNRLEHRKPYREYDFMQHPRIRVIEIPKSFSEKVLGIDLQFHEMWAKNIGIRRAVGEYILGTNIDVLWLYPFKESFLESWPMVAWRWSVYHPVLDLGKDMDSLRNYCFNDRNRLDHDRNSNGDFTLLHKEGWERLQGYSITLEGWAGQDMWMVKRASDFYQRLYELPFPIFHIRHPGAPLASSYGVTNISPDWGAPKEDFSEWINGEQIK